jgi:hypothetical protein
MKIKPLWPREGSEIEASASLRLGCGWTCADDQECIAVPRDLWFEGFDPADARQG